MEVSNTVSRKVFGGGVGGLVVSIETFITPRACARGKVIGCVVVVVVSTKITKSQKVGA